VTKHDEHCFIVMAVGRNLDEQEVFTGWYKEVIEPAVLESGLEPVLALEEQHPNAINDEIRAHLAFDPMVIVDLGGVSAADAPNANVMYELGIRHAFDLPLVLLGWEGQRLPFDIANQRVIMCRRVMVSIRTTRDRILKFIRAAQEGDYYRPMEAVARRARLEQTVESLDQDSAIAELAREVQELRVSIETSVASRQKKPDERASNAAVPQVVLTHALGDNRAELHKSFKSRGGTNLGWGYLTQVPQNSLNPRPPTWSSEEWQRFVKAAASVPARKKDFKNYHSAIAAIVRNEIGKRRASQPAADSGDDEAPGGRLRVHELAKETGTNSKEILSITAALGIPAKTHSSSLSLTDVNRVRKVLAN